MRRFRKNFPKLIPGSAISSKPEIMAAMNQRLDNMDRRIERIEKRLEPVP